MRPFIPQLSPPRHALALLLAAVAYGARVQRDEAGPAAFYLAALVCSLLSLETSWEWFAANLAGVHVVLRRGPRGDVRCG